MQFLRLLSFVSMAATMAWANQEITEEKRLLQGENPLSELTQIGGGALPVKRLSTSALPITTLTNSLEGVTAVKRAIQELVSQEKRLSTDSIPGADMLTGILGGGLPTRRQFEILNQLGGLGGLAPSSPVPLKRLADPVTAAEGILSGASPTKRQMEILEAVGGLAGIASSSEKRQLEILNALAGGQTEGQSEFKRQLDLLDSLPTGNLLSGADLPIERDVQHNKRLQMGLRALPGSDIIPEILSTGTEAQKRLVDALGSVPGTDAITSLASGGLPSRRQLDLLNAVGGIGSLAGQSTKRQLDFLSELGNPGGLGGLITRENLNDQAMMYVHEIMMERSQDGKGQRPSRRANSTVGNCSTGTVSCCNQEITDESKKQTLAGLAGLDNVVGNIALSCSQLPIGVLPIAAQNVCSQKSLCCDHVTQDGLINFGCVNIPIN